MPQPSQFTPAWDRHTVCWSFHSPEEKEDNNSIINEFKILAHMMWFWVFYSPTYAEL